VSIDLSGYWDANRRRSPEEASVSDPETFPHFEFIGLGPPAEGWRAVYRDEQCGTLFVQPLVTWALFHHTWRDECGEVVEDWGNVMEGVVWDRGPWDSVFDCAARPSNFVDYLEPGAPPPAPPEAEPAPRRPRRPGTRPGPLARPRGADATP
jgi:hypothetical protein